jgi:hypothetical protein
MLGTFPRVTRLHIMMISGKTVLPTLAFMCLGFLYGTSSIYGADSPALAHCVFNRIDDHFAGSCGALFHQTPAMTLRPAKVSTFGVWRDDMQPISVWLGDMSDEGYRNAALELDLYSGGQGVLRTEYGWFPVTDFVSSSTLRFDLDASSEVKPNALDEKIVQRAAEILSAEQQWNRADNRKCPQDATKWSIYCALEKSTIEVTGGFHHRRPALEVVRTIIEERTATRNYHHHMMDYNNDPTTSLQDVQSVFKEALRQMGQP